MRTVLRLLVMVLTATVMGGLLTAWPASAHSRLVSSSPKAGATLPTSPEKVVLTFNEKIGREFVTVQVRDAKGKEAVDAKPVVNGSTVTLPVADPVAAGAYSVVYKVVSADGHPIAGSMKFTVTGNSPSSPSTSPSPSEPTGATPGTPSEAATPTTSSSEAGAASEPNNSDSDSDSAGGGVSPLWWIGGGLFGALFVGLVVALRRGATGATGTPSNFAPNSSLYGASGTTVGDASGGASDAGCGGGDGGGGSGGSD